MPATPTTNRVTRKWIPAVVCMLLIFGQGRLVHGADPSPLPQQDENELLIENKSELPDTYPQAAYEVQLWARHGVVPLHWHVVRGTLPPGIKLDERGLLRGSPERTGDFEFTVSVTDSGKPTQAVEKRFLIRVHSALTLNWKSPARVNGNRIEGTVEVSNSTPDSVDLTFIALAVAANGRATAIGYQHFVLPNGTLNKELPFGENLPSGGYVVHIDVVGEVAPKRLIYRERLQTPAPLQVLVGP